MRLHRTLLTPMVVVATLLGALGPLPQDAVADGAAAPGPVEPAAALLDPVELALMEGGPSDDAAVALVGQSVVWHNESPSAVALTSDSGVIDSGPIPPGGAYAATFPGAGILDYQTDSGHQGKVIVGDTIPGAVDSLVLGNLPDLGFPLLDPADAGIHPELAIEASRTRILLGFTPTTTVGEANAVLARAGTPLVGTLPTSDISLVLAPDTTDFSGMDAALAALRAEPTVEFASVDPVPHADSVPDGQSAGVVGPKYEWDEPTTVPDPGVGSNWQLEAVRAPQAWNLTEALKADAQGIQAAVVDTGFKADHPDLQGRLQVFEPCFPSPTGANCATNDPGVDRLARARHPRGRDHRRGVGDRQRGPPRRRPRCAGHRAVLGPPGLRGVVLQAVRCDGRRHLPRPSGSEPLAGLQDRCDHVGGRAPLLLLWAGAR